MDNATQAFEEFETCKRKLDPFPDCDVSSGLIFFVFLVTHVAALAGMFAFLDEMRRYV